MKITSIKPFIFGCLLCMVTGIRPLLTAQPGTGIHVAENLVLIPSYSVSIGTTDNVKIRRRALSEDDADRLEDNEDDVYLIQTLAVEYLRQGASYRSAGRTWISRSEYFDNSDLSAETYGISGKTNIISDSGKTTMGLGLSLQRAVEESESFQDFVGDSDSSQEIENVGERVERYDLRGTFDLGYRLTERTQLGVAYSYTQLEYEDSTFRDQFNHRVSGNIRYSVNDYLGIKGTVGSTYIDQDTGTEDIVTQESGWEDPFYSIGLDIDQPIKLSEKVTLRLGTGVESRTRTKPDGTSETTQQVNFDGRISYLFTPRTEMSLTARNGYDEVASPGGTTREEFSATASLSNRTTEQITQRLSVTWRNDDYLDLFPARGGLVDEEKETTQFRYNVSFRTQRPWLKLFANASYEIGETNIEGDDYTETRLEAGATLSY